MCWIKFFSGLLTPFIALITILIAYRQWKDSHYKIKIDLFDKRMEVYEIIKRQLIHSNKDEEEKINYSEFYSAISKATFLFDKKINDLIVEIYEKIQEKISAAKRMQDVEESQERHNLFSDLHAETSRWLVERQKTFEDIFSKFMKLNMV